MEKQHLPDKILGSRIYLKVPEPADAQTLFDGIDRDRGRLLRFLPWSVFINKVEDQLRFIEKSRTEFNNSQTAVYGLCWIHWQRNDPRWRVIRIDTTDIAPFQTIDRIVEWVKLEKGKVQLLSPESKWWERREGEKDCIK